MHACMCESEKDYIVHACFFFLKTLLDIFCKGCSYLDKFARLYTSYDYHIKFLYNWYLWIHVFTENTCKICTKKWYHLLKIFILPRVKKSIHWNKIHDMDLMCQLLSSRHVSTGMFWTSLFFYLRLSLYYHYLK